jgi:ATP-dependent helicase HrpA
LGVGWVRLGVPALLNPKSIRYPADLPITARREEIVAAIRGHQVLILAGETGSGKTRQWPIVCLEAAGEDARGVIGCTQPQPQPQPQRVAEKLGVESAFGATA